MDTEIESSGPSGQPKGHVVGAYIPEPVTEAFWGGLSCLVRLGDRQAPLRGEALADVGVVELDLATARLSE